jgi:two-component system, chemotaxis family, sensor kinase CheA
MKIPLTLAIAPALIVEVNKNRFALPQHAVVEAVSIDNDHLVEKVQRSSILRLREKVLPVASLSELLGLEDNEPDKDFTMVVVMRVGQHTFGILVDGVADVQEIVVKPLGTTLSHLTAFSGHTILGDGSVVLILDPAGLASSIGLEQTTDSELNKASEITKEHNDHKRLLMFKAGSGATKILPLSLISRIETVSISEIKQADDQLLMEYQHKLINLVMAEHEMKLDKSEYPILIINKNKESFGIIVDEIIDIIDHELDIQIKGQTEHILGTTQIRDEAVELVDLTYYFKIVKIEDEVIISKKIMLIHDKQFFKDLLLPILKINGYNVDVMNSVSDAEKNIKATKIADTIIISLDTNKSEAINFALKIKKEFQHVKIIGLASKPDDDIANETRVYGIENVIGHFDRYKLLDIIKSDSNLSKEELIVSENAA